MGSSRVVLCIGLFLGGVGRCVIGKVGLVLVGLSQLASYCGCGLFGLLWFLVLF